MRRFRTITAVLFLSLILPLHNSCTETDPTLVLVGGVSIFTTGGPLPIFDFNVEDAQVTSFEISQADLSYDNFDYDLLGSLSSCSILDSALALPTGDCFGGVVVGSTAGSNAAIALTTTLEVRRAEPFLLPDGGDYDGDGVLNEDDLCPLQPDPDNLDEDGEAGGDACQSTIIVNGVPTPPFPDADLDLVADLFDNCPFTPNEDQMDSDSPSDGIGDACVTETAMVTDLSGNTDLTIALTDFDFEIADGQRLILNFDFNFDTALSCDWMMGVCTLDTSLADVCLEPLNSSTGCSSTSP